MESQINLKAIEDIMWLPDEDFETAVKELDLREILCLMEALQTCMCEEQLQFEQLTRQLQKYPDRNSYNHRKISAALCTVQSLLTNLCTKHMMCSGQRSLRSSFEDDRSSLDNTPIVKVHKMASGSLQNGSGRTSGFRESLRFFQNQVDKVEIPHNNDTRHDSLKPSLTNGHIKNHISTSEVKPNGRINNTVPSVDNILSNVKNLCSTRSVKNEPDSNSKFSHIPNNTNHNEDKIQCKLNPIIHQTSNNIAPRHDVGVTRSEQVSSISQKTISSKSAISDHTRKKSLLSKFNPSLEFGEADENMTDNKEVVLNAPSYLKVSSQNQTVNGIKSSGDLERKSIGLHEEFLFGKVSNGSSSKTVSNLVGESVSSIPKTKGSPIIHETEETENRPAVNIPVNRTFGQCKEKLSSQVDSNKTNTVKNIHNLDDYRDQNMTSLNSSYVVEEVKRDEEDCFSEKQCESFESDFDSHDFVVHKATFPEDYVEVMSEDNYSSVNDDYEVEHPNDPDIPSPDYASDEEEYLVQHGEVPQYEDVEFVDNSAQYANDPRRYIYYPEDKELEVIPEEDEEDIEDDDIYNHDEVYKRGSFLISNPSSDDSRYNNHGECDSGLTDDQRSSSSMAEDCDIEDDTDSAKGSLPLQDSSSESPTYNEKALNMFQNVEYHKHNKRSYSAKRLLEDFEKPKLKGKTVEHIPNVKKFSPNSDEKIPPKNNASSWDPKELLDVLYRLDIYVEPLKKKVTRYINKEGHLEKLPSGRKKATYWNPWKTKYIKLKDGFLHCFDNVHSEKPSMTLQLMGGHIDTLENKMLGIDDQKGHYLVLKCPDDEEAESWENALQSQCAEDFVNAYTSPCPRPLSIKKNIIIIDLGGCSVRAGILMSEPTLPQLFFPTVSAMNKISHKNVFGIDALKPEIRKECQLSFPLCPSAKVSKYSIDVSILPDLLSYIFQQLNVSPKDYKVILSMPQNLSFQTKHKIACLLLDDFKVKSCNVTHQAILSLHGYNSKSGIIVNIGDRLDVIPIIEGYIVESGVSKLPFGGQRMIHHLKQSLAEKGVSLFSDVETYIARYVLEQLCYVAENYNEELQRFHTNPDDFEMSISTKHFLKNDMRNEIILDLGRFHVPEGLFVPEKWGLDHPGLHKLVHHAIQESGVDMRREMSKSIYVGGGLTLLPGFVERLEDEINKLTPNTVTPKVHASPYRYHMSYLGACQIALEDKFEDVCITKQMWRKEGNTCVKKWHI